MAANRPAAKYEEPASEAAEPELVARIRAGDASAFEVLFETHYDGMCALAFMLVRSREAAEDVVANVFRNLWGRRFEWQPTGPVRTYLLTATRNEAINLLRRLRREHGLAERLTQEDVIPAFGSPTISPDDAAAARELGDAVEKATAGLSRRCRNVFLLRWHEGLKYQEIAQQLGISIKTVEMHMTNALKTIRDQLRRLAEPS